MSETTLTQDEIQAIRDRSCDGLLHVHGVMGRVALTVSERDALCYAAARAETLEAVRNVPPLTDEEVDAFLASTEEPKEPTPHE